MEKISNFYFLLSEYALIKLAVSGYEYTNIYVL
jgi:hypothetical protein